MIAVLAHRSIVPLDFVLNADLTNRLGAAGEAYLLDDLRDQSASYRQVPGTVQCTL